MKVQIVSCSDKAQPLTDNKSLQECLLAGETLGELQIKNLQNGGLEVCDNGEIFVRSTAWLDKTTLKQAVLQKKAISANGVILAAWSVDDLNNSSVDSIECAKSFEIYYAWDLLKVNEEVISKMTESDIQGDLSPAANIEGFVKLGKGSRILPGVFIEGNVIIGEGCKVGPNCYIRGNTSIGDNCHVGQSVEIKNSILMKKTNVGHLSYVGDSVLGNLANFGAGTTTSNLRHDNANQQSMIDGKLVDTGRRKFGVIIGDGVHTGINTSFYPGRKMSPQSSTLPGEVVKYDK
ncbi:MAG: hypothetical protein HRT88_06675 [Lentisphaeraceae bacterium]|nr:hypothetical protein [Lentisphaeraceae bacterium]